MIEKPPLGIIPRKFHDEKRMSEIKEAFIRYMESDYEIPVEWLQEYNELVSRKTLI